MSDLRKYHLELAHKFQVENPQWHVTVASSSRSDYIIVHICGFNDSNELYGNLSLDIYAPYLTTRLEYLVKHGYNPEVSA